MRVIQENACKIQSAKTKWVQHSMKQLEIAAMNAKRKKETRVPKSKRVQT